MAKATKTKKAQAKKGEKSKGTTVQGKGRFNVRYGGDKKEIEKELKAGSSGAILRIAENEDYTVAVLTVPSEWARLDEHAIAAGKGSWAYIPCAPKCPVCERLPNESPRPIALVPIYVYDNKKVQYYRAPSTAITDLMLMHDRYGDKGFLNYDWIITRIDSDGPTRYDFDRQIDKVSKKIKLLAAKIPDLNETLEDRFQRGMENMGWLGKKSDTKNARDKGKNYEEGNDDINLEDIDEMDKEELLQLIDDYKLKVTDPDEVKLKPLRKIVAKMMKKKLK